MSNLTYCISAWGGVFKYKLQENVPYPEEMHSFTFRKKV